MADTKLTLQDRINMLIIVSSILFISALTFIQLNNQLSNLTQFNTYQANLSSIIVKNNLETVIRQIPKKDLTAYLQSSLNTLVETMIIKDAYIFDKKGTVIASTTSSLTGNTVRYKDLSKLSDLEYLLQKEKWFITDIDEKNRRLDIYLTLRANSQQPIEYVAKISFSLGNIQEALLGVYQPVIIATIIIVLANILLGYLLFKTVVGPIKLLNKVTKMIADGNLSVRANIRTNDELQELGSTFNYMTEELVKMKERAENANPLTKLPGNIVIREQIEKQIREKLKFVVIYCDLDNFKAFNDKYGIARGDEAIKLTAEIFKEAISGKGNPEDFIGHEGGDDFILITTPDKTQGVAEYIIEEFNARVGMLYDEEELERGYIVTTARDGSIKQFPIMTISLAGVTNIYRNITSYGEVTNIAAEVKKKAKSTGGSVFFIDRRHT